MSLTPNEIYSLKLNSGEELIAKVIDAQDTHIILHEPVSVAPGPQGLGLVPSLFTSKRNENVRLNTSSVALIAATDEAVKSKYIEAVTGIKMPDKKIVMG